MMETLILVMGTLTLASLKTTTLAVMHQMACLHVTSSVEMVTGSMGLRSAMMVELLQEMDVKQTAQRRQATPVRLLVAIPP